MNTHIYIEFTNIKSLHGKITHYFHFIYAVFIPIIIRYIELSKSNKKITFIINDNLGPFFRILLQLPIDIKLKPFFRVDNITVNKEFLIPLDIHPTRKNKNLLLVKKKLADFFDYNKFQIINNWIKKEIVLNNLTIFSIKYDIVIIERKIDVSYQSYITLIKDEQNTTKKMSATVGSERRSIINHKEFVESIKKYFPKKKILNISLEYLPLFEQYNLFNNAKIIIAQHGAALANIIFMKSNSLIIEIMTQDLLNRGSNWFMPISKTCKINHLQYVVNDYYVKININDFTHFMDKNNINKFV